MIDIILHKDWGDIALSQNGVAKQGIIYESVDIGEIIQVHDYLFANLVYDGRELPGKSSRIKGWSIFYYHSYAMKKIVCLADVF